MWSTNQNPQTQSNFSAADITTSFLSQLNHLIDGKAENDIHVETLSIKSRVAALVCSKRQRMEGRIQEDLRGDDADFIFSQFLKYAYKSMNKLI